MSQHTECQSHNNMKCWTVKLDLNFSFEYFFLETLSFSVLCTEFSFRCSILSVLKTLLLFLFLARHQLVNPLKSMLYFALLILGMAIAPSTTTTTAPLLSCFMNRIIWHPRVCHELCLCFALLCFASTRHKWKRKIFILLYEIRHTLWG